MDGAGASRNSGKLAREQWKVPSRTIRTTAAHPFGVIFSAGAMKFPAALLTSVSSRP